ncbi:MAG: serine hydrolase domain-containing protein [Parvibaculum sp.]
MISAFRIARPLFVWMFVFATMGVALSFSSPVAHAEDPRAAGGMLAWPQGEMATALQIFVPNRMQKFNVPGLALAVVSDGKIVYAGTFGKADRGTKTPVTPSTLFDAGELGETVAAYAAMGMVDDKLLFLDAPLSRDLETSWLTDADDSAKITLREVLTHGSGLGDNVAHPSHSTRIAPGTRFSHSGVGFLYLQHVMEALTHEPFDVLMQDRVFKPIGMEASGYLATPQTQAQSARGYVSLSFLLKVFYLPFAIAFILILVTLWLVSWFLLQRRLDPIDVLWPLFGASVFAVAIVWWGLGFASAVFVVGGALLCALVVGLLGGIAYYLLYVVGLARARDGIISRGGGNREGMVGLIAIVVALVGFLPALYWSIPVMRLDGLRGAPRANVATSFHTTASDMARFMIEVLNGDQLGDRMKSRMLSERVAVGGPFYWSLFSGVRVDENHETFWTRGSALGFESLMVMDPSRDAGVVVLTNSRAGGELAQDIARNILGVEAVWSLP